MNPDLEVLNRMLKQKYLKKSESSMNAEQIGIHVYSGSKQSVFYELWGADQIFRLIIFNPHNELFTSKHVGNNLFFSLIEEENNMRGGFIDMKKDISEELSKVFPHIKTESLDELSMLWNYFVKEHYYGLTSNN